jgi:[ribosomal protein S18]-alanine N-acetyltransferase
MILKRASITDLHEIGKIEADNFTPEDFGLSIASLRYHLKKNTIFIIKDESGVIGYCLWLTRKSYYRLYSIAILQAFQSKGYANMLLEYSLKQLNGKDLQLEVKTTNLKAISLYEKFGFKIIKKLTSYYPDHIDRYLMKRSIA